MHVVPARLAEVLLESLQQRDQLYWDVEAGCPTAVQFYSGSRRVGRGVPFCCNIVPVVMYWCSRPLPLRIVRLCLQLDSVEADD